MARTSNINIIRTKTRAQFTALPNRIANDDRLSAAALGVLYYVLTKPTDWKVIPPQLGARFRMSYRRILKLIGELSQAGYVKREIVIENYRITGTKYLVTDEPGFFGEETGTDEEPVLPADPFVDFRACSKSSQTEKRHPIQRKERYKNNNPISKSEDGAAPLSSAEKGPAAKRQPYRPSKLDRGRIELQIANRIGAHGFAVLMDLPESEVEALCLRQRRGTLDEASIEALRRRGP